jgi:hypothetical protein
MTRPEAIRWLTKTLVDAGGKLPMTAVIEAAIAAGCTRRTMQRARVDAGVVAEVTGFGKQKNSVWRLGGASSRGANQPQCLGEHEQWRSEFKEYAKAYDEAIAIYGTDTSKIKPEEFERIARRHPPRRGKGRGENRDVLSRSPTGGGAAATDYDVAAWQNHPDPAKRAIRSYMIGAAASRDGCRPHDHPQSSDDDLRPDCIFKHVGALADLGLAEEVIADELRVSKSQVRRHLDERDTDDDPCESWCGDDDSDDHVENLSTHDANRDYDED